tara:strand:- start:759 stop:980 length:222 start_codon:yes stop_codon:yes gene_type:complete
MEEIEEFKKEIRPLITKKADWFTERHFTSEVEEFRNVFYSDAVYYGNHTISEYAKYYYNGNDLAEEFTLFEVD